MLAKDIFHAQNGELRHKLRTVKDLIRFIETKENKDVSNYSIFLGAGASRSSGISTASELINGWMKELYERYEAKSYTFSKDSIFDNEQEDLIRFFEKNYSSWFDSSNAYSSLFERKFDLAPQRRRFVEKEVDGKLPSIGYAYLVSLVENSFFNAIFTTNFDDLLNEAFYQLSSTRPIVCAHDSSVHSISVSSKRPKIIKLHGDYLFENIKSTLRETESLESNTSDKLKEFCKEYGLIVVGYAGNDRSIMDILDFLIKNDTYLRNGVYWCLRGEDYISPTLKNLFWKERVYPVLIDGFDEFFAEVHHELLPNTRFLNNYKETKQQKIIQKIIKNREYFINDYIAKDITEIEFETERQDFSSLLIEDIDMPDDMSKLKNSFQKTKRLIEIDRLANEDVEQAYEMAKKALNEENSEAVRNRVIQRLIDLSFQLKYKEDCNKWMDLLIESDPFRYDFYRIKLQNITSLQEKYDFAISLENKFTSNYEYYNHVTSLGLDVFDFYKSMKTEDFLEELNNYIDLSLKLNPSLQNDSWKRKIRYLHKCYGLTHDKEKKDGFLREAYSKINEAKRINEHDIEFFSLEVYFVNLFNESKYASTLVSDLFEAYNNYNKIDKVNASRMLNGLFRNLKLDIPFEEKFRFYKDYVDFGDSTPIESIITKIEMLYLNKYPTKKLLETLNEVIKKHDFFDELDDIVELANYIEPKFIDKIETILKSKFIHIKPKYYNKFMSIISCAKEDFQGALDYLEKQYEYQPVDGSYFSRKSYLLLKDNCYDKVVTLKSDYDVNDYDFEEDNEVLIINTMYANKMLDNSNFDEEVLRGLSMSNNRLVNIASRLLVDSTRSQAIQNMINLVKEDPRNFLTFNSWVFLNSEELTRIKDKILINDKINSLI